MTSSTVDDRSRQSARRMAMLLLSFVVSICLSAFLLFQIQPMFTKMILPRLGGTPAVWSVAMVVFQTLLLCGYLYAHLLMRFFALGQAVLIHAALLIVTFCVLPIGLPHELGRAPADGEMLWLVGVFLAGIGLPFFALSANGPLLQAWFSRTQHPTARDPYFLYAASNIGSFAGLLLYPILVEPMLPLAQQAQFWSFGFAFLTMGLLLSGALATRHSAAPDVFIRPSSGTGMPSKSSTAGMRLSWTFFAFVPSALMVAVTSYISTDIGSAPFLWVLPLTLFLFTFIVVFRDRAMLSGPAFAVIVPIAAMLMIAAYFALANNALVAAPIHLAGFFAIALCCHARLYESRPAAVHLTEFYLFLSLGGALGGFFTGILAPALFSDVYEYPILIAMALLCLPMAAPALRRLTMDAVLIGACAMLVVLLSGWLLAAGLVPYNVMLAICAVMLPVPIWLSRAQPHRMALLAVAAFLALFSIREEGGVEVKLRSFFGVNKVALDETGQFRRLFHGTTVHGMERIRNPDGTPFTGRPVPTVYYTTDGPMGMAIAAAREASGGRLDRVGIAGLGAGALACLSQPGEKWSFFEIDPDVIRIASDASRFRFLSECGSDSRIVQGDARLTIEDERWPFDLLLLDAFSSDSVPTHLLTTEAIRLYANSITPNGVIVLHISNRFMSLKGVVASAASEAGLVARWSHGAGLRPANAVETGYADSQIMLLAKSEAVMARYAGLPNISPVDGTHLPRPWTDDYANILGAILAKGQ